MADCTPYPDGFTADMIDMFVNRLATPTGIWADFSPALYYWYSLKWLAHFHFFPADCLPAKPNPADYPNTTADRTWDFDAGLCRRYGIPTDF